MMKVKRDFSRSKGALKTLYDALPWGVIEALPLRTRKEVNLVKNNAAHYAPAIVHTVLLELVDRIESDDWDNLPDPVQREVVEAIDAGGYGDEPI